VNGYLLDTSVALLSLSAPERIAREVRASIEGSRVRLSVITYWEVVLKTGKGKLDVGDPRAWWPDALDKLTATPLTLRPEHVARIYALPSLHRDPFDRALIAQAIAEDLTLVTTDAEIPQYESAGLRVLR
jgi:PIN domain nuclease of toxin-antitoxin system